MFATLAHYLTGAPASQRHGCRHPGKDTGRRINTLRRWVLQEHVWTNLLDESGFTDITTDVLPATTGGPRTADTLLVSAQRHRAAARPRKAR